MMKILIIFILFSQLANGQIITASSPYRITAPPPYEYILDNYTTAAGAWSLRKLKSDYSGNCIKVRRSNDNTTQDIGFVNNEVDTASMKSFVGSNSGYIDTWYDQSGNSRNLTQTTNGNQPRIIDAGTVFRVNSKVAVKFIIANSWYMTNASIAISGGANFYALSIHNADVVAATNNVVFYSQGAGYGHQPNSSLLYGYAGGISGSSTSTTTTQILFESVYNGGGAANADRLKIYKNNSQLTISSFSGTVPATVTSTGVDIGRPYGINAAYLGGSIQEIIVWFNDKSASMTGIEANVNTYYSIY